MRRALVLMASLGLFGTALGCKWHGICDCDVHPIYSGPACGGGPGAPLISSYGGHPADHGPMPPPAGVPSPTMGTVAPEAIQAMPH
jgi:hypothetical protein